MLRSEWVNSFCVLMIIKHITFFLWVFSNRATFNCPSSICYVDVLRMSWIQIHTAAAAWSLYVCRQRGVRSNNEALKGGQKYKLVTDLSYFRRETLEMLFKGVLYSTFHMYAEIWEIKVVCVTICYCLLLFSCPKTFNDIGWSAGYPSSAIMLNPCL